MNVSIPVEGPSRAVVRFTSDAAWRATGWLGLLLTVVGVGHMAVNVFPLVPARAEWEFATVPVLFGGLPLVTMGLAALLASFLARGIRWGIITMVVVLLVLTVLIVLASAVFVTDVPLALRATGRGPGSWTIRKAIARTIMMGVAFSIGYLAAVVVSVRALRRRR